MLVRTILAFALVLSAPLSAAKLSTAAERYLDHVKYLASDQMRGRGDGMPELNEAARYIADHFREDGLEPAGENGYLQPFTVTTGAEMGDDNSFTVTTLNDEYRLAPREDYMPVNFSSSGQVSGEVVFVGYGISAEEKGYDDYAQVDVKDKIVIVMRYEPPTFTEGGGQGPRQWTHHANLISKAIKARNSGAKAVVLVNGRRDNARGDELIKFGSVAGPENSGILMVQAKNDVVEKWLRRSGKSLRLLQRDINLKTAPQSFALADNFKLSIAVDIDRQQATVNNVVAYLPGETDEYVVIGAHYDHLGLGDENSLAPDKIGQVHHGADDNASGTAGLIELARRFADQPKQRRGALFIAFAGEEIGLLGSQHWVENPTRPLDKAVAMLNMDMIGRISKNKVYIGGLGTAKIFDKLVEDAAKPTPFEISPSRSGYSASDHTSFTAKGVPILFFFSGLHGDYHKPSDTWDKINAEGAVELLDLVADSRRRLAHAGRPSRIHPRSRTGSWPRRRSDLQRGRRRLRPVLRVDPRLRRGSERRALRRHSPGLARRQGRHPSGRHHDQLRRQAHPKPLRLHLRFARQPSRPNRGDQGIARRQGNRDSSDARRTSLARLSERCCKT